MNLTFVFPIGLLALGALLVPLLLHLARRSEYRTVDFAALRWLAAHARPRRRLRLVEHGLLLVRLALVTAIALLLAGPVWTGGMRSRAWTVVVPGVSPAAVPLPAKDSVDERRWLSPGLPRLDQPAPQPGAPIGSLLRELDARLPAAAPLTVWVPRELAGLDGASIELARPVRWRVAPGAANVSVPRGAARVPFAVRFDADRESALIYLRAAWRAWAIGHSAPAAKPMQGQALPDVSSSANLPADRRGALVWLRSGDLPREVIDWVLAGGTILVEPRTNTRVSFASSAVAWRDDDGRALARTVRSGRGRVVRLEAALDPAALPGVLDGSFASALREMLHPPGVSPARALAKDVAPIRNPSVRRMTVPLRRDLDMETWLVWLIAVGFVIERIAGTAARRWRSA